LENDYDDTMSESISQTSYADTLYEEISQSDISIASQASYSSTSNSLEPSEIVLTPARIYNKYEFQIQFLFFNDSTNLLIEFLLELSSSSIY
ncbi:8993_t:CDS:2, partial [Cetraspora pellucida]